MVSSLEDMAVAVAIVTLVLAVSHPCIVLYCIEISCISLLQLVNSCLRCCRSWAQLFSWLERFGNSRKNSYTRERIKCACVGGVYSTLRFLKRALQLR